jgi:hypothetical protein
MADGRSELREFVIGFEEGVSPAQIGMAHSRRMEYPHSENSNVWRQPQNLRVIQTAWSLETERSA